MPLSPVCQNPFAIHRRDLAEVFEYPCGHQFDRLACGCITADDHTTEPCDGRTVAELEETNA
jgi:hypothetical protein